MISTAKLLLATTKEDSKTILIVFENSTDAMLQLKSWKSSEKFSDINTVDVQLVHAGHFGDLLQQEENSVDAEAANKEEAAPVASTKKNSRSKARPRKAGLQSANTGNARADDSRDDVRTTKVQS